MEYNTNKEILEIVFYVMLPTAVLTIPIALYIVPYFMRYFDKIINIIAGFF